MAVPTFIFDLDGVIVSTDEYHYQAWKQMADEEGIWFDRKINERLRGVSRSESLEIILEKSAKTYDQTEKEAMASRKNTYYRNILENLTPDDILPGVSGFLASLKTAGIRMAIGSSSKNTPVILKKIGLDQYFDAVADGNQITNSKPDPEVFRLAAAMLGVEPGQCVVVEDAEAGVLAARAAGMKVIGVGSAAHSPNADFHAPDLSCISAEQLIRQLI